jgi:DNA-binding CsgD family transcriptional regulator/tetratricopeptide (TPR) repeat protein
VTTDRAPLLEREEQLGRIRELIDASRRASGSLVLIAGEAGAGKTSLVRALASEMTRDTLVLQGYCDPLVTPRPLSPLYDIAADPDSGLTGLLGGDETPVEIFAELVDRLRRTSRPVVMVIEDVHWADTATLDLIRFVGRRIDSARAVMVCTYRDDEVGPAHPLRPVLGQVLPLPWTQLIRVPPLSEEAVAAIIGNRRLDAERVHALTGGNAFFVTEIIAGGGDLPPTIRDAVLARVSRLDEKPRRVVETVSIAPRFLELDRATFLAGTGTEDADAALAAGVILVEADRLRFRHELARAAVEESIPPARRLELHRTMLQLLEHEEPPDLARLAHHAIRSHSGREVAAYAPDAGREASQRASHRQAVEFFLAALDHSEHLDADTAAHLRVDLAQAYGILDHDAEALIHAERAAEHFIATDQPLAAARALAYVQGARWSLRDIPGSVAGLDDAIRLLEPLGPTRELAHMYYRRAHHLMLARHRRQAVEAAEMARRIAESASAEDVLWTVDMIRGTIDIVLGDAREGALQLRKAADEAKAIGNADQIALALSMIGSGGGEARIYDEAIPALEECVEHGLRFDQDARVVYARAWLARVAFEQGRWDDAATYVDLVDKTAVNREAIGMVTAFGALGRVRVRRGDPGGPEVLAPLVERQSDYEIQHVWSPIAGLAEHHWLAGRIDRMADVLRPGYERAIATDSEWARGELGFWMWKAGAIDGPPDGAALPFQLHMEGRWHEAAAAWRDIGCPYEEALALSEGDPDSVLSAIDIFDGLGARPAAAMARAHLRDMGVDRVPRGPNTATRSNPAGLTERQLEVLVLMAAGKSNGEIADRLFVSKKTVEHHVSAIFTKLGVTTRAKAIEEATRIGAVDTSA